MMPAKNNTIKKKLTTVFLGCSNTFNYVGNPANKGAKELKRIITSIRDSCPEVYIKPWWEFVSGGEYIMQLVADNILSCDFCIFVVAKDVETTYPKDKKNTTDKTNPNDKKNKKDNKANNMFVPNSNVLIELGFALAKGKKTLVLNWDPDDVIIPSDLKGKFYTDVKRQDGKINHAKVTESFKKVYRGYIDDRKKNTILTKYKNINIYYNESLANELTNPIPPKEWGTKAMFIGSKSSKCWADIERNGNYAETGIIKSFINQQNGIVWEDDKIISSVQDIFIDNIVSFGPGAGTIDNDLVRCFRRGTYTPFYIPIDISIPLVTTAIDAVSKKAGYPIPFAIVDDFEEGTCFNRLKDLIESKEYEIHKRNLFSIVGVTFSNYSQAEDYFFDGILEIMNPEDDYLLLDVAADRQSEDELKLTVHNQINTDYKDWVEHSVRKRFPEAMELNKKSKNKGNNKASLMDKVKVRVLNGTDRFSRLTNVSGTRVLDCYFEDDPERNSLLIIKHYDYENFKNYLKTKFVILASSYMEEKMRGLFILKKK